MTNSLPMSRRINPQLLLLFLVPVALVLLSCESKPTDSSGAEPDSNSRVDPIAQATRAAQGLDFKQFPVGTEVDQEILGPIRATFVPESQTTEYVIDRIDPLLGGNFSNVWSSVPCGSYVGSTDDDTRRSWHHAHPPCDETTNHGDVTIIVETGVLTSDGGRTIFCEYTGAHSGIGTPCRWGDQTRQ